MLWWQEVPDLEEIMEDLRYAIGKKDEQIARLLESRFKLVEGVWMLKRDNGEPYLVTLSHGYDPKKNCIYFHCAREGKKIDILNKNPVIWGQAMLDEGYVQGKCDHLYATTQFKGKVVFLTDFDEKKEALLNMVFKLDETPQEVIKKQITEKSVSNVTIGRIDIDYMSGKQAKEVVISL